MVAMRYGGIKCDYFNPGYNDPDGSILFQSSGAFNGGSCTNPIADALVS
jgi:hypothetical protein